MGVGDRSAVAFGALAAWWTPRGPLTTTQALSAGLGC
jgi:hypothetical protein